MEGKSYKEGSKYEQPGRFGKVQDKEQGDYEVIYEREK